MTVSPAYPLLVLYDGSCRVCAKEMETYKSREHGGRLQFVDINSPGFDPAPHGISLDRFMYEMHAIDSEKRVYRGVEAFAAIWQAFPSSSLFRLLGAAVMFPGMNLLARTCYWCFARIRRFLPKNDACGDGSCRLGRGKPEK